MKKMNVIKKRGRFSSKQLLEVINDIAKVAKVQEKYTGLLSCDLLSKNCIFDFINN